MLASVSLYVPFQTVAINPEGADVITALVVAVAVFGLGCLSRFVAVRLGLNATGASYAIGSAMFFFLTTGPYLYDFPLGRLGLLTTGAVIAWIVYRLRDMKVIGVAITWGVFVLVLAPAATAITRVMAESEPVRLEMANASHSISSNLDVVVFVADAYPSEAVLTEFYGFDNSAFVESLRNYGLTAGDTQANYSMTVLSLPSVLQMEFLAKGDKVLTDSDTKALFEILGGDNQFARTLVDNGYQHVFVESGWLGTQCGNSVDICVKPPWPGETFFDIGFQTVLRDIPGLMTGTQFNRGAQNAIEWLDEELPGYLNNGTKDYIYVHVLAPHPPLFFESDCTVERRADMGGFVITGPDGMGAGNDVRRAAYVRQVECINSVVLRTAKKVVDASAVFIFFGDHGPDGREQLFSRGDLWTDSQIAERFGTFSAVSVPGCATEQPMSLVDLLPPVLECFGTPDTPSREPLTFIVMTDGEGTRAIPTQMPEPATIP